MAPQGEKDSRPTLKDVADLAGVSPITVSRAIRGSAPVSETTRRRIEEAITKLNYVPNEAARQLVRGRPRDCVGILLHNAAHYLWTRIAFTIEANLAQHGFSSMLADTHESHVEERRHLERMVLQGVRGIIASPSGLNSPLPRLVRGQGLPLVLLNSNPDRFHDTVAMGEAEGMQRLTRQLLGQGHRRIALVYRAPTTFNAVVRRAGFEAALREAGVDLDPRMIWEAQGNNVDQPIAALLALPQRPTAIIAGASWAAFGVLCALSQRQVRVPDDIEVAVFGEMPTFGNLLTHVSYEPVADPASRAVEMLVERIHGYAGPPRSHVHPVGVILREGLQN